jgi:hypothetical protein
VHCIESRSTSIGGTQSDVVSVKWPVSRRISLTQCLQRPGSRSTTDDLVETNREPDGDVGSDLDVRSADSLVALGAPLSAK